MPGEQPYPLGVYHQRPPSNFSVIDSYDVGDSLPANVARRLTSAANDVNRFFTDLVPFP